MTQPVALILATVLSSAATSDSPSGWASLARTDAQALHDILQANHPGPVDPENPAYGRWLEAGLAEAVKQADGVTSYSAYLRVLQRYANGFQDGHIGVYPEIGPTRISWPGFVLAAEADGVVKVRAAEADAGVKPGDEVKSCDGQSLDILLKDRVDPYFWNRGIPHSRLEHVNRLFWRQRGDPLPALTACDIGGRTVTVSWRRIGIDDYDARLERTGFGSEDGLSLQRVDGVWFLTLPSFNYHSEPDVAAIRSLIQQVRENLDSVRSSTLVIDVRGNGGGNSAWGEEIAMALWGEPLVRRTVAGFDNTVDWRASDKNIAYLEGVVVTQEKNGLNEAAVYWRRSVDAMKAAKAAGRPLARVEERPQPQSGPAPANPFTGKVFFLTDQRCASACLDFADVVRRMPGVTHVGLPTSADAVYIDNTYETLPSGVAGLSYSMKVYRNRVRGNNEWYEPQIRWPGGVMSRTSVAAWVKTLP